MRQNLTRIAYAAERILRGETEEPQERTAAPETSQRRKPRPLDARALHGITGELVRLVMPHTESGMAAFLIQFLIAAGLYIGRTGYYQTEGDRHYSNLFAVIVGDTSKGRKGTSWGQIRRLFSIVDPDFTKANITSGISSGEGIIWAVRDEIREQHPVKGKGGVMPIPASLISGFSYKSRSSPVC